MNADNCIEHVLGLTHLLLSLLKTEGTAPNGTYLGFSANTQSGLNEVKPGFVEPINGLHPTVQLSAV